MDITIFDPQNLTRKEKKRLEDMTGIDMSAIEYVVIAPLHVTKQTKFGLAINNAGLRPGIAAAFEELMRPQIDRWYRLDFNGPVAGEWASIGIRYKE